MSLPQPHSITPLFYYSHSALDNQLVSELELPMIYSRLCDAKTPTREKMATEMAKFTTTDKVFLKKMRTTLRKLSRETWQEEDGKWELEWKNIQRETSFEKKYLYLDFWHHWNHHPAFLQIMSIYHITSPMFSLLFPILLLILPFLILLLQGVDISVSQYLNVLQEIAQNHAIGKLFFSNHHEINLQEKAMTGLSLIFYLFSIYQNFSICVQFYRNYHQICNYLRNCREYLDHTLKKLNQLSPIFSNFEKTYQQYYEQFTQNLREFHTKLVYLEETNSSTNAIFRHGIGETMACFYAFCPTQASVSPIANLMETSFHFHAYWDNLHAISLQPLGEARFTKSNRTSQIQFRGAWYPVYSPEEGVKNNLHKMRHLILTGPNASGKTTLLKTLFINTLLTQQFGKGCYQSAKFPHLFSHFYCYINIPDTSGRDSLFQAEARRCKEILDTIQSYPNEWHFCMLDELYSGTNPEEATQSAQAFMSYLTKQSNVVSILTTHFTEICSHLPYAQIKKMHCFRSPEGQLQYTYQLKPGISKIKGAKDILKEMNYPMEILSEM